MQPSLIIYVFVGLFGLAIGSFLNVLIYRLPRKKKTIRERSACPHCGQTIPVHLNIPIISFLILGGKCNNCQYPISFRYPLVEFLNAALYVIFLYYDGLTPVLPIHYFLVSSLIVIFFIDLEFQIIPDKITLPGIVIGLTAALFVNPPGIINALLGFAVGGGALIAVAYLGEWLFKKEAMGGGDIKMAAMMGAFVGWQKVLLIFLGGAVVGMFVSIAWMLVSKKIRSERVIPFGPFLALAALIVVIYGDQILNFYVSTFLAA
jgi:leader peptidase (prepilin peptidase)/N-methyltransferase